jgi:hypothetical protein
VQANVLHYDPIEASHLFFYSLSPQTGLDFASIDQAQGTLKRNPT